MPQDGVVLDRKFPRKRLLNKGYSVIAISEDGRPVCVVPNFGLEDIGYIMKKVSLSNEGENLAEIVINNIHRGVLEPPMWRFVNTSNGIVAQIKRIEMPQFELFDTSSLLAMLGLTIHQSRLSRKRCREWAVNMKA